MKRATALACALVACAVFLAVWVERGGAPLVGVASLGAVALLALRLN